MLTNNIYITMNTILLRESIAILYCTFPKRQAGRLVLLLFEIKHKNLKREGVMLQLT